MLKNPFDRYKLCVGGSGEAGFSSGGSEPDSSYDSGAGSVSSNPGVSTSAESQAVAAAAGGINIGTPSPSGTGMVWSGTGWTSPSNVPAYAVGSSYNGSGVAPVSYIGSVNGNTLLGIDTSKFATIYNPVTGMNQANDSYRGTAYTSLGYNNETQGIPTGYPGNLGYSTPGGASQIFNQGGGAINPGVIALAMGQGNPAALQQYGQSATSPDIKGAAYAMAVEAARRGDTLDPTVYALAKGQGYKGTVNVPLINNAFKSDYSSVDAFGNMVGYNAQPVVNMMAGRNTVPIRDLSSGMENTPTFNNQNGRTVTTYAPYGSYAQQEILNSKLALAYDTGELGIYQQPYGHSLYNLVGGGGRAALQSGMFTVGAPQTPYITSQWGVGNYELPSGKGMSRLGAEAYGGFVMPLDNRLLTPESKMSTYANTNNLAGFVNQEGANIGKLQASGANIPWAIGAGSPALQYMDEKGIVENAVPIGGVASLQPAPLAPGLGVSDIAGMQRPFTSVGKSAPVPQDFTLSPGFSPLGYVLKESVSRIGTAQGLIGEGVSYANELLFPKPNTRFENTTSIKVAGGNTTITNLGNWIDANVGRINPYNEAAVDQYNSNVEKYNSMIGQNPVVTTTETKSLSTTIPSGGEAAFLSSLIPQISPQFQTDISQWFTGGKSIDQILSEQTELWKPQKGVSGIAGMVSTSPIGGEYAALERYIIPAGLAVIGTLAIQNGQNYDLSSSPVVQRAQELWEGGGSPIQLPGGYNLPKITDVIPAPLYNAPGEGYRQIVNIPGQGLGIIAQLPGEGRNLIAKTGEVIGQGFVGFGNVIQMPKSSITPEDVISPGFDLGVAATAKITEAGRTIVTDRPIFDLSVDTGAKNAIAAKNTASDYISKTGAASALALQTTLATPFWWTQSDYTTKLAEQTGISSALDTSYPKTTGLSLQQALVVPAISTLTQPLTKIITSGSVENGMQYDTIEGIRSKPPQEKIELKKLSLPSLGGGGGGGGGFRSRKRRKVELFSFELGKDTPIPTRYGLAGQTTQYIPGTRGIAANILNPADIAPNSLLTIGRRSQEDRL